MKLRDNLISATVFLLTILVGIGTTGRLVSANSCIPAGQQIHSANFSVWTDTCTTQVKTLHQITGDWDELGVTWNSFAGSYIGIAEDSFTPAACNVWGDFDVTGLVQDFIDGTPNYGFLLKEDLATSYTRYYSRENSNVDHRPELEICFTETNCMPPLEAVADTYIWALPDSRDTNFGTSDSLFTGLRNNFEKQSLVRFEIETCPLGPGTGTPGYWKNHPEAWPVAIITIGCISYSRDNAIEIMQMPGRGDKTYDMFQHLVAAKLNVIIGNPDSCIAETIVDAEDWMCDNALGSDVRGNSAEWDDGEPLKDMLDDYNNGDLCAPHRGD